MSKFYLSDEFDPKSLNAPSDVKVTKKYLVAIRDNPDWRIKDYSEFFSFINGHSSNLDLSARLADDFAENFSFTDEGWEKLNKFATDVMKELKKKHSKFYRQHIHSYGRGHKENFVEFCIEWANKDLNELAVNFAEMVTAVDDVPIMNCDLRLGI